MIASLHVNLCGVFLMLKKLRRKFKITSERNGARSANERAFEIELSATVDKQPDNFTTFGVKKGKNWRQWLSLSGD